MMKKLIIFIICLFSFPTFCFAENKKVEFFVQFADDVNLDSIGNIYVYYTDKSESEYSVTLKKEHNYVYSYNLYDGTDINRVKVDFDQNNVYGESSILKTNDGYNIYIDIKNKDDNQIIIKNDEKIPESTTTQVNSTVSTITTRVTTNNANATVSTTSSKVYQETKQNKAIRSAYIIIATVIGFFVSILVIVGIIKIVNANK